MLALHRTRNTPLACMTRNALAVAEQKKWRMPLISHYRDYITLFTGMSCHGWTNMVMQIQANARFVAVRSVAEHETSSAFIVLQQFADPSQC